MRLRQEATYAGLAHLCNAIPVWGLLFCGWIMFAMREESRHIMLHTRQAMVFHALMLTMTLAYLVLEMLVRVLSVLMPLVGRGLHAFNTALFLVMLAAYISICLWGAYRCFSGRDFRYPLIGRRA